MKADRYTNPYPPPDKIMASPTPPKSYPSNGNGNGNSSNGNGRTLVHYTHDSLRKAGPSIISASFSSSSRIPPSTTAPNFSHPMNNNNTPPHPTNPKYSTWEPTPPSTVRKQPPPSLTPKHNRRDSTSVTVPDTPVSPLQEYERELVPTPTSARPTPPNSARPSVNTTGRVAGRQPPTPTVARGVGAGSNRAPSMVTTGHNRTPSMVGNTPAPGGAARQRVSGGGNSTSAAGRTATAGKAPVRTPSTGARPAARPAAAAAGRNVSTATTTARPAAAARNASATQSRPPAAMNNTTATRPARTPSLSSTTPAVTKPPTPRATKPPPRPPSKPPSRTPSAPNSRPGSVTQNRAPSAGNSHPPIPPSATTPRRTAAKGNLTTPPSASRGASVNASPTPTAVSKTTATSRQTASTNLTTPSLTAKKATFDVPLATSTPSKPSLPPISTSKSTPMLSALIKSPTTTGEGSIQRRYEDQGTLDLISGNYADAEALLTKALAYADVYSNKWSISIKLSRALAEQREFAEAKAVLVAAEKELSSLGGSGAGIHGDEYDYNAADVGDELFNARVDVRLALAGICEMAGDIDDAESQYWSIATDTRERYGSDDNLFLKAMLKEVELLATRREKREEQGGGVVVIPPTPMVPVTPIAPSASVPNLAAAAGNRGLGIGGVGVGVGIVSRVTVGNGTASSRRQLETRRTATPPTVDKARTPPTASPRGILRDRSASMTERPAASTTERPPARRALTSTAANTTVTATPMVRNHSSPRLTNTNNTTTVVTTANTGVMIGHRRESSAAFAAARRTFSRSPGRRASISQNGGRFISRSPSPYTTTAQPQENNGRRFIASKTLERERGGIKTASSTPTTTTFPVGVSGGTVRDSIRDGVRLSEGIRGAESPAPRMLRASTYPTPVRDIRESVNRDVTTANNATLAAAAKLVERHRRRSRSISPSSRPTHTLPTSPPKRRLSFTEKDRPAFSENTEGRTRGFRAGSIAAEMIEEARARLRNRSNDPPESVASDPMNLNSREGTVRLKGLGLERVRAESPVVRESMSDGGKGRESGSDGGGERKRVGLSAEELGRVMEFLNRDKAKAV